MQVRVRKPSLLLLDLVDRKSHRLCYRLQTGHDNKYFELAQSLRQRITEIKIRIDRQMKVMAALKGRIREQVTEMQRLEVWRERNIYLNLNRFICWW